MTEFNQARSITLPLGFALIVIIMMMLAYYSLTRFDYVNQQFRQVVNVNVSRVNEAQKMRVIARERSPLLFALVNAEDSFDQEELIDQFRSLGGQFMGHREHLLASGLSGAELALLEEHREKARVNVPEQRKVISLVQEGKAKEAMAILVNKVSPDQIIALRHLDDFIALENHLAEAAVKKAEEDYEETIRISLFLAVVGSLLSFAIAAFVSLRFQHFVRALKTANEELEGRVAERTGELEQLNQKLVEIATHDTLTGLPNRAALQEQLDKQLHYARRHKQSLAIMFLDLDGFKAINDTYGHDYGDELLRQVSSRMGECVRQEDTVARLGGDEFTIVLTDISAPPGYELVASRIIEELNRPFDIIDAQCQIGCSIGISLFPEHADDEGDLLKFADDAMYQVKAHGKNAYRVYQP